MSKFKSKFFFIASSPTSGINIVLTTVSCEKLRFMELVNGIAYLNHKIIIYNLYVNSNVDSYWIFFES